MAASHNSNINHRTVVTIFVVLNFGFSPFCYGLQDLYSNSHISPNSQYNEFENQVDEKNVDITSNPTNLVVSSTNIEEAIDQTIERNLKQSVIRNDEETSSHVIIERSASPILGRQFHQPPSEADGETNDVEIRIGKYNHLTPTRTIFNEMEAEQMYMSTKSGEELRAPRGRNLLLQEPNLDTAVTEMTKEFVSETPRSRQANPDIQDIITGIVKLLNGNVNVQANTAPTVSRPVRPSNTRINNRGPPRISEVAPLPPEFELPNPNSQSSNLPPPPVGQMTPPPITTSNSPVPTKIPPPYPFDMPPQNSSPIRPFLNGVPLPEQIVPLRPGGTNYHGRPQKLPPWHRRPRPPPPRFPPNLAIPPYKPMPSMGPEIDVGEEISLTSEDPTNPVTPSEHDGGPMEDVNANVGQTEATFHDLGDQLNNRHESNDNVAVTDAPLQTTSDNPAEFINKDDYIKDEKKPFMKEKDKPFNIKSEKTITVIDQEISTSPFSSESPSFTATINPTPTRTEINISTMNISLNAFNENVDGKLDSPSITEFHGIGEAIPVLETSIKEIETIVSKDETNASLNNVSTPTDGLPVHYITTQSAVNETKTATIMSTSSEVNVINNQPTDASLTLNSFPYYPYRPRPGIVLDDTEYKPGGQRRPPPIITARPTLNGQGDIFDVTVSAIQGPGSSDKQSNDGHGKPFVIPVELDGVHLQPTNADIITSQSGSEGFVSIDGKRTYLNLFGDATEQTSTATKTISAINPTKTVLNNTVQITGMGYAIPQSDIVQASARPGSVGPVKPAPSRRPVFGKRPQPPVRIDTCIVGDDSTCDAGQQEMCRTDMGVSSCHCRPGHSRRKHREPCRRVVAILMSLRVDKMYERRIVWDPKLSNKDTDEFRQLSFEASRAVDSAMSMTPFSDDFLEAKVNNIYKGDPAAGTAGVFVNLTIHLEEDGDTLRPQVKGDIQRHLLGAIQRRSNNIGNSALWVDGPAGAVSGLSDLDECSSPDLNDCHKDATCTNVFGGFMCQCNAGLRDPWSDNRARSGRKCESCPISYCNNRGQCKYEKGQQICVCQGNFYGSQCEVDGEVVGVAVGASVAALIIIVLTLVCLVMWSRKWNREQKAAAAAAGGLGGLGSPVFGYMTTGAGGTVKTPAVGPPPYQLTLEDRMRWAHLADVMAQANHYAQPEPGAGGITRPSSAVFGGYPTLSIHGTMGPPVPLPRLGLHMATAARAASVHNMSLRPSAAIAAANDNTSSSEEEDHADLLGRNFQVPRPKSRSSIANQSGIYYDVDYEQGDMFKHPAGGGIPMSTYTAGRPPYFRN